jgi:hypothetical protein
MERAELERMILNASKNGYGDWANEWAIKTYVYPLSSALIASSDWERITEGGDGSTIQGLANVNWLVNEMRDNLNRLVEGLVNVQEIKKWSEFYLAVNTYGLVYHDDIADEIQSVDFDFAVTFDGTKVETVITIPKPWPTDLPTLPPKKVKAKKK